MEIRLKKGFFIDCFIGFGIILFSLQVKNLQSWWTLSIFFACIFFGLIKKNFKINFQSIVLFLGFTLYFYFWNKNNEVHFWSYITYWIGPVMFYLVGYNLIIIDSKRMEERAFYIVALVTISMSLFAIISVFYKAQNIDIYNSLIYEMNLWEGMKTRYSLNMWTNDLIHPTNLNSYCVFFIILFYAFYKKLKGRKILYLYISILIGCIVVSFQTASRTNLYLFIFMLSIGYLYDNRLIFKKVKISNKNVLKYIFISIFMIGAIFFFKDKLISILNDSALFNRIETENLNIKNDGRWSRMFTVLKNLSNYPFGNMPFLDAHNLFLDIARVAGIIPMIIILQYSIITIITTYKAIKNRYLNKDTKLLMLLFIIGVSICFSVEPVIEGRPYVYMISCMINGIIYGLSNKKYISKK